MEPSNADAGMVTFPPVVYLSPYIFDGTVPYSASLLPRAMRIKVAVAGGLPAGRYFIRVYGQGLLREYALAVTR